MPASFILRMGSESSKTITVLEDGRIGISNEQWVHVFFHNTATTEIYTLHETGIIIRPTQVTLSPLDTSVQIAFRERDARGAQVQIWRRTYDVDTQRPVSGLPEAWFSGFVNEAPISTDVGSASLAIDIVSTARVLTIASARKKSDQAQRLRSGDRFRRYKATAGEIDLAWAQEDRE